MLQESKTNELEYQRLPKEEMEKRGILGRLVGVCADIINPTRNGRKYPEKLWENVFNDPIMKERIENGVCYGELGHPADREETDMEKICVCLAEQPKKGKDGKLRAVFDILNTPNGRILKSLCDYGSTLGISSRGSGDLEMDYDGQESVNPDTYNCEGFDIVLVPAVKAARLQYVTEALDKKRYNKTLREKLTESIQKETEEHQKVINESLSTLGVDLAESQYNDYEVQNTESGTVLRDSKGDFVQEFPTEEEAVEWVDDQELEESVSLDESSLTPEEKMDLWHAGERKENIKACGDAKLYKYREICKDKNYVREVLAIDAELQNRGLDVPEQSAQVYPKVENTKPTCAMENGELHILFDNAGKNFVSKYTNIGDVERLLSHGKEYFVIRKSDSFANALANDLINILNESYFVNESLTEARMGAFKYTYGVHAHPQGRDILLGGSNDLEQAEQIGINQIKSIMDNPFMTVQDKSDYIQTIYISDDDQEIEMSSPKFEQYMEMCLYSLSSDPKISEDIDNINTTVAADDDGAMIEELQRVLSENKELQDNIIDLQEKLSVSYTKEINLQEELDAMKTSSIKLSATENEVSSLKEQLTAVKTNEITFTNKCKKLSESIDRKTEKIQQLVEQLSQKDNQLKELTEELSNKETDSKKQLLSIQNLTDKYETLNKDYQQMKEGYSKKLDTQNQLVEKYRDIAIKSVNKYIDMQATRLGVKSEEIKNRLPESYSFKDIDVICEDLQEYKLNMSTLPFSTRGTKMSDGLKIKATNVDTRTLVPMEEDLDDLTLRLAGYLD